MLEFYENYLKNVSQTPEEAYRENAQAYVDSVWENTFLLADVEEETEVGSDEYSQINVRKTTITEYSTNMFKNADDNRRLTFKDCNHKVTRGLKYKFDDNFWIAYSDTDEENVYSQISIKRCNNELKWIDKYNGAILSEPCSIGEESSGTNPVVNKGLQVASGRTILMVQGNDNTDLLNENQRFIISGIPYKLNAYNNYAQNNYIDKHANLLWFYLQRDVEHPSDDIENGIANRFDYTYKVNINQDSFEQTNGYVGKLTADVTLNDDNVDREIVWEANEYATISQDGTFTLVGNIGDVATIKAYINGNPYNYDSIDIKIVDSIVDKLDIIISPLYTEIGEYEIIKFNVSLYKNNVKQNNPIIYSVNNVDEDCYTLSQNGNDFTLQSLCISDAPLIIKFESGGIDKTIEIKFKPIF